MDGVTGQTLTRKQQKQLERMAKEMLYLARKHGIMPTFRKPIVLAVKDALKEMASA